LKSQRPILRTFLDAGVPDSVASVFRKHGHTAILHREALPEKSTDAVVCATALANDAILVAIDGDMKTFAKRFGISQGSTRFARLSIIRLCCNEVLASKRLEHAMSFIEHEWSVSEEKAARRLWVEIGPHFLRSNR
jgi:predicted nuclease of predicted toxin-antitoxin system